MRSILECLPLPKEADQGESHNSGNEARQRSRSSHRDLHGNKQRSITATQMKDLQRVKVKPFTGQGMGYDVE